MYAYNTPLQRLDLWKELISLSSVSIPWCVVGDFNSILHLNEVSGGREQWTSDLQAFSDCVNSAGLDHIHTLGNLFTWQNNCPQNLIHKRLDRALGNKHWFYDFSEAISLVKPRGLMDHCPIIISVPMAVQTFPKPFQYFHFMSNIQGFHSTVAEAWSESWYGDPLAILCRKLKNVKKALVQLNKNAGNVHSNVTMARDDLHFFQNALTTDCNNPLLIAQESDAQLKLHSALITEEKFVHQKSRTQWLDQGDGNNSFFFNKLKANWNHNKVLAINDANGVTVFGQAEVSKVAVDYFTE